MTQEGYHEDVKYEKSGMISLNKFRLYAFPSEKPEESSLQT